MRAMIKLDMYFNPYMVTVYVITGNLVAILLLNLLMPNESNIFLKKASIENISSEIYSDLPQIFRKLILYHPYIVACRKNTSLGEPPTLNN